MSLPQLVSFKPIVVQMLQNIKNPVCLESLQEIADNEPKLFSPYIDMILQQVKACVFDR